MPRKHEVTELTLNNGASGLLIHVPDATTVRYDIHFWAGGDFVRNQAARQTAHVMEHMAFGPNKKFASMEAYDREFTKNGAYHNAFTSTLDMEYVADAALMEWDRILDFQTLAITEPVFTQASLDSEKGNVREELMGYASNHSRVLWQNIMRQANLKRLFDPEEMKTIDAVTLEGIKEHYRHTHTMNNMNFVFAGDLKSHSQEIVKKLEAWQLPKGKRLIFGRDKPEKAPLVCIPRKELPSITFNLAFFINRVVTPAERQAMSVVSHALTGTFYSRIFGVARKRGICYGMGSRVESEMTGESSWWFSGQVSPQNAPELFQLIIEELAKLRQDGLTEEELKAAKDYRLGSFQMGGDTVNAIANWYAGTYFGEHRIDYVHDMPGIIAATTLPDITKIVNEFLQSDAWAFGGIGNVNKTTLQPQYDAFADFLKKR